MLLATRSTEMSSTLKLVFTSLLPSIPSVTRRLVSIPLVKPSRTLLLMLNMRLKKDSTSRYTYNKLTWCCKLTLSSRRSPIRPRSNTSSLILLWVLNVLKSSTMSLPRTVIWTSNTLPSPSVSRSSARATRLPSLIPPTCHWSLKINTWNCLPRFPRMPISTASAK